MAHALGTPEKTALIALLIAGGEVSNPDLKEQHGIELRKETREKLNRAGLILSTTKKRTFFHQITDKGIAQCEEEFATGERPPRAPTMAAVLCEFLVPATDYFRHRDLRLVDVLLESMIRRSYAELAEMPGDYVPLAKLRPVLDIAIAGREEVDRVLLDMTRTGLVHLVPESDQMALTQADRDAAIKIGSEHKHLVAIEES